MTDLFTRADTPHTGPHRTDDKGKPYIVRERVCGRCGGAGGSDKWAATGWTCYDCGGAGRKGTEILKLYTREQLNKLDAAADKRLAKKQAAAQVRADARQADTDARREAFQAKHGALIASATPYRPRCAFLDSIVGDAIRFQQLSDKQVAVIERRIGEIAAEDEAKAASHHFGQIGERITTDVTVERVSSFERAKFSAPWKTEEVWIVTMRTPDGAALVSKSPRFYADKGDQLTIKATIKDHTEYRGEAQTLLERIAVQ